jgi:hypothetical protein
MLGWEGIFVIVTVTTSSLLVFFLKFKLGLRNDSASSRKTEEGHQSDPRKGLICLLMAQVPPPGRPGRKSILGGGQARPRKPENACLQKAKWPLRDCKAAG